MSRQEATRKGIAFWLTLITSIGLGIAGFLVPPTGEIDGSILKYVSLLLGFATIAQIPVIIQVAGYFRMTKGDLVIETSKKAGRPAGHRDNTECDEGVD